MQHTIVFDGGNVEMKMIPTRVVFDIAEIAGGAADTKNLGPSEMKDLMKLLSGYCTGIYAENLVEDNGYLSDDFATCPLPWGMQAFEAVMGFFFPEQTRTSDTSASGK